MKRHDVRCITRPGRWRGVLALWGSGALVWALTGFASAQTPTSTITTTYAYNADGALTQVVRQVDDEAPEVTDFAWDNFVADPDNPSEGTVTLGNGNLLGYGPDPESLTQRFSYDLADRLRSYTDGEETISYGYHPTWLLAESARASGDSFHFYYDQSPNPQVTNIEQSPGGEVSSRLGPLRALSDGTQQVLLAPRKDVSGVYDPELETFSAYNYDPYGAALEGSEGESSGDGGYDLEENPFRYAEEYRDPTWGGYYLRARWYMPDHQVFLTRDPVPNLNRYGYTEGNPIVRADPSGRKFTYKSWKKGVGMAVKALQPHNGWGDVSRVLLGPVIGVMAFVADPYGFFKSMGRNYGVNAGFLIGTLALEVATDQYEFSALTYRQAFGVRLVGDVVSGVANSAIGATRGNFHRFNKRTFYNGLEFSLGSVFYSRFVGARGYRPRYLSVNEVTELWQNAGDLGDDTLVFRVRRPMGGRDSFSAGPIGEAANLGYYHDSVVAIAQDRVYFTEVVDKGSINSIDTLFGDPSPQNALARRLNSDEFKLGDHQFQYMGRASKHEVTGAIKSNPTKIKSFRAQPKFLGGNDTNPYRTFWRNCQRHASAVLGQLTLGP